jgi:streptogramin lyase
MTELVPAAVLKLGATADWVVITQDAVWVGSTGPNAVHRIDPRTNRITASVPLPGEPCAYMTAGFGHLWAPLCGDHPGLAKVNLKTGRLAAVFPVSTPAESGIAAGGDSLWMVTDAQGSLARIDPVDGHVRQTVRVPAGAFNTHAAGGTLYVSNVAGAQVTAVDVRTGRVLFTALTGSHPRFMAHGGGAIWALNQGDGTLTRIDPKTLKASVNIEQGTSGHGGDVAFGAGRVWTTVIGLPLTMTDGARGVVLRQWTGPGGDSLGIGHGAIWLTDYRGGTVSRIPLSAATRP